MRCWQLNVKEIRMSRHAGTVRAQFGLYLRRPWAYIDLTMMTTRRQALAVLLPAALATGLAGCMPPSWGAGGLLHPGKRSPTRKPTRAHESVELQGEGVKLAAWKYPAEGERRGTVIYLHGAADNRGSSLSVADHFVPPGFDVIAYDSRAHGDSEGKYCTYGFYEKRDLIKMLDGLPPGPVVLLGSSLGAAVALQTAAIEKRITAVISIATFSDLRTVGTERAPFVASAANIRDAFAIAEKRASFSVDEVSPMAAAPAITAPVLLFHGKDDDEAPPAHSQRVFDALVAKKELILVPDAGHNLHLDAAAWKRIDAFVRDALSSK